MRPEFLKASGAFSRPGTPPTLEEEPIPPLDVDLQTDPGGADPNPEPTSILFFYTILAPLRTS